MPIRVPSTVTEANIRAYLSRHTRKEKSAPGESSTAVEGFPCTMPVFLLLPYPPLNNRYYRHVGPRVLLSAEGRRYKALVAQVVQAEWPRDVQRPFNTLLVCSVTIHVPSLRHKPDADAVLKGPLDAMAYAGVYLNDKQIKDLHVYSREPRIPDGCLEVTLEPYRGDGK